MNLFPKNSTRAAGESDFAPSSIVMYENDNTALLAVVIEFKKNKYILVNERGREIDLQADRLYSFGLKLPAGITATSKKADYLTDLHKKADSEAAQTNLQELWSFVSEDQGEYSCRNLFELYYGHDAEPEKLISLRLALIADKVYFKRKKEIFHPRTADLIDELLKSEKIRLQKLELQRIAIQAFKERRKAPETPLPPEILPIISLLEDIAADSDNLDNARYKEARDFLTECATELELQLNGSHSQRAYNFLRAIKHFNKRTNLSLLRNKPNIKFGEELEKFAEDLQFQELFNVKRIDLTNLAALTIDDSSTLDMDDALSIEHTESGYRLGIHISDVASALKSDSPLDKEACSRATSLYLADLTVNMLPKILAQNKFSLVCGEKRHCISYMFNVDRNFNVLDGEITPSIIEVKRRLDYDQVNTLFDQQDHDLEILHNIAATREMFRYEKGGMKVNKRDAMVILGENETLLLQEIDEDSPARSLVSEMMILANELSANFAAKNNLSLIFRSQETPDPNSARYYEHLPEGPARDYQIRVNLKKSVTSLKPAPHATLGLAAYCQVTSPIRRYADLCNQRQLVSFLTRGVPFYSDTELNETIEKTENTLNSANLVARETKRFWLMLYLDYFHKNKTEITGTVVRTDLKTPMVELDQVYLIAPVRSSRKLNQGDNIKMKIVALEPHFDYLRLEDVS